MGSTERISVLEKKVEELEKVVQELKQKCDQLKRDMPAPLSPAEQRVLDDNIRH